MFSQNHADIENNCEEGKSGNGEDHETFVMPFQQPLKIMLTDGKCQIIYEGHDCECFESKKPRLPEGIMDVISL